MRVLTWKTDRGRHCSDECKGVSRGDWCDLSVANVRHTYLGTKNSTTELYRPLKSKFGEIVREADEQHNHCEIIRPIS